MSLRRSPRAGDRCASRLCGGRPRHARGRPSSRSAAALARVLGCPRSIRGCGSRRSALRAQERVLLSRVVAGVLLIEVENRFPGCLVAAARPERSRCLAVSARAVAVSLAHPPDVVPAAARALPQRSRPLGEEAVSPPGREVGVGGILIDVCAQLITVTRGRRSWSNQVWSLSRWSLPGGSTIASQQRDGAEPPPDWTNHQFGHPRALGKPEPRRTLGEQMQQPRPRMWQQSQPAWLRSPERPSSLARMGRPRGAYGRNGCNEAATVPLLKPLASAIACAAEADRHGRHRYPGSASRQRCSPPARRQSVDRPRDRGRSALRGLVEEEGSKM